MTYPYGTKGAPVVGNGLGGLPRRAVAAAAAAAAAGRARYDVSHIGTFSINNMPGNAQAISPLILMGGKGLVYLTNAGTIYRFTFNYSESGVTGGSIGVTAASYGLPQVSVINNNGVHTFSWRQTLSPTQTLFKFTGMRPFLVTWDGTNDSTFTQVPSSIGTGGTYSNGGTYTSLQPHSKSDAFLLPSGNLITFAQADSGNSVAVLEYSPTLTLERVLNLGSVTGSSSATDTRVLCRKTSYGYVVAIATNNGGTTQYQSVYTLNSSLTTIISSSVNRTIVSADGSNPPNSIGINAGSDGVAFHYDVNATGYYLTSKTFKINSTGTVTNAFTNANFMANSAAGSTYGRRYMAAYVGRAPEYAGCTKSAEYSSASIFKPNSSGAPNDVPVLTVNTSSFGTSWDGIYTYSDVDYTPVINSVGTVNNGTVFPLEINRNVCGVYTVVDSNTSYGLSATEDDDGFVVISGSSSNVTNRLLKKVYR